MDIAGGLPENIADATNGRGGAWSEDGTIIFTPAGGQAIFRVAASGGPVTPLTTLDGHGNHARHRRREAGRESKQPFIQPKRPSPAHRHHREQLAPIPTIPAEQQPSIIRHFQ